MNKPRRKRVLSPEKTAILNSILQKVVLEGTGHRAALPDRPAAGKTGTTENYGDAWFVGYTPQLAAAVWVGYPQELRPMLTDYHGDPVAGGTYPAEIWKAFMESALEYLRAEPVSFPATQIGYGSSQLALFRDGRLRLDNGRCNGVRQVVFLPGEEPRKRADCKPNEVEVPSLVGATIGQARERLAHQPLTPRVAYKPAAPGQRPNVVLDQVPARGHLSAYDRVILVVAKPTHGVVPRIVGLSLPRARRRLQRSGLRYEVSSAPRGRHGRVVFQVPRAGVAAGPGMLVRIAVAT
jgi:membrane peptidoglycan carboxypeptidase